MREHLEVARVGERYDGVACSVRDHLRPDHHRTRSVRSDVGSARVPHSAMAASTTPRLNSQGIRFCTRIARLLSVTALVAHQGPNNSPIERASVIPICCVPVKRKSTASSARPICRVHGAFHTIDGSFESQLSLNAGL
jgi:hypothetical protein